MRTSDFDYHLPPELIAQEPADRRDGSRLLVLPRRGGALEDRRFHELPDLLPPDALVVLNDSRVFPARLRGRKPTGGGVEVLLVSPLGEGEGKGEGAGNGEGESEGAPGAVPVWRCLCRSSKGLTPGGTVGFGPDPAAPAVVATVVSVVPGGGADLAFSRTDHAADQGPGWVVRWASEAGETPLPPYIQRPGGERALDRERYQTVYAREPGSVAAPTAGLHFTPALLEALAARGPELAYLTLHVGPGTFRPVRTDDIAAHQMDAERVEVSADLAEAVNRAKEAHRPVVAVGTTTVRALEGMAPAPGRLEPGTREVSLFITPGYELRIVDMLITNFHLPRSTLLMLVSALAGIGPVRAAYDHAVRQRYRFYSYGDAMLIR